MRKGHSLGRAAESMAEIFFCECGFTVLARRYRRQGGEIDLVVARRDLLVFVEVKARRPSRCGSAIDAVSAAQLARLRRIARLYLFDNPSPDGARLRFDVVAVDFGGSGRGCVLRHLAGVG